VIWAHIAQLPTVVVFVLALGAAAFVMLIVTGLSYRPRVARLERLLAATSSVGGPPPPSRPIATPAELAHRRIIGRGFWLTDLAHDSPIIHGRVFRDCDIRGPAMIRLMSDLAFKDGGMVGLEIYPVDPARPATGVIGLRRCKFVNCWFYGIGIMAPASQVAQLVQLFRQGSGRI
jgi:hypothetical protein